MTSLVLELQRMSADSTTSVSELLRRALLVASKLDLPEIQAWLTAELKGYASGDQVPPYRRLKGQIRARNYMNGVLMPVSFGAGVDKALQTTSMTNSVADVEALLKGESDFLTSHFGPERQAHIREMLGEDRDWVHPFLQVGRNQIAGVLEAVRTRILEMTLELERQKVLGDGMTFSDNEKQRAKTGNIEGITIQNFHGVLGHVSNSSVTVTDYSSVHGDLKSAGITQGDRNTLETYMEEYSKATPSEKPTIAARAGEWIAKHAVALGAQLAARLKGYFGL